MNAKGHPCVMKIGAMRRKLWLYYIYPWGLSTSSHSQCWKQRWGSRHLAQAVDRIIRSREEVIIGNLGAITGTVVKLKLHWIILHGIRIQYDWTRPFSFCEFYEACSYLRLDLIFQDRARLRVRPLGLRVGRLSMMFQRDRCTFSNIYHT